MTRLTDNLVVRAVARVSTTVQRKLLVAFAIVVVLLVTVGALGLGVLSQSNNRVGSLGQLPKQLADYQQLEVDSAQLNSALTQRSATLSVCFNPNVFVGNCSDNTLSARIADLAETDGEIKATLDLLDPLTVIAEFGFVPPPDERSILSDVRSEYVQISTAMQNLIFSQQAGTYVDNLPEINESADLIDHAVQLVSVTEGETASLIAQNQASYLGSQHLFIGVAAGSAVLALLLGVVLSWAIVGPVKQMRARLGAIGAGDFSDHVNVPNRDELGALAADINRMNDELGRLYRELETASRHKSEFLANMSHELRTPLNAVIGFSDLLLDHLFGDLNDKQVEYVTDINTSGRHLLTLINDILDLSKIEAGRMDLQVSSFVLSEVLQNSVALLRERATRQGLTLGLEADPSSGVIDADERVFKQVLFNLLSNALNFTGSGGHVEVMAHGDRDGVVVSVRDDGIGIDPADQARIFEEFEQAGEPHPHAGTGLGLPLSRRFVELHGGRLSVESALGQGSTFTFTLPRTGSPSDPMKRNRPAPSDAAGLPLRRASPLS
jgi:signal transduction histidine kinase